MVTLGRETVEAVASSLYFGTRKLLGEEQEVAHVIILAVSS